MKEINVIIVEDESGAADNLKYMLADMAPQVCVVAVLCSIEEASAWLEGNTNPDLGFFDIQLEDGLSFEIFKQVTVNFPVIFTTAFDQYAIDAFKVNSVDYLLKPIKEEDLLFSINKFEQTKKSSASLDTIESILRTVTGQKTTSFLVHFRDKLVPVSANDIGYFYIEEGLVHGCSFKNSVYPIDQTLDDLENSLDKHLFFRANRQFIINRKAVQDIEFYFNGRLAINLNPQPKENVLISKARVPVFKAWMKS